MHWLQLPLDVEVLPEPEIEKSYYKDQTVLWR
jgi:hypothetical protein